MYSTNVYKFKPRQVVVLYSGNSTRRYQIVYAKNLTLNKGVDNIIQFQFLNQEQKFIDISSFDITFRLINYTGKEILFRKALTATLPLTGIAELVLELKNPNKKLYYNEVFNLLILSQAVFHQALLLLFFYKE